VCLWPITHLRIQWIIELKTAFQKTKCVQRLSTHSVIFLLSKFALLMFSIPFSCTLGCLVCLAGCALLFSSDVILGVHTVELIGVKGWQIVVSDWLMYSLCIFHLCELVCVFSECAVHFISSSVFSCGYCIDCSDTGMSVCVFLVHLRDTQGLSITTCISFFPLLYLSLLPFLFIHLSLLPQLTRTQTSQSPP